MPSVAAVIDLGGTNIKGAAVLENGETVLEETVETGSTFETVTGNISRLLKRIIGSVSGTVKGIGIGVPGNVNIASGTIDWLVNIPVLNGFCAGSFLENEFHLPIYIDNDATCAARGEFTFGAGRSVQNMICVTLGTGVGAGLVLNGSIYTGATDYAGEFGHMIVQPGGHRCNCGNSGCLERYASATAIVEAGAALFRKGVFEGVFNSEEEINPLTLERSAASGNPFAASIYAEAADKLGISLASVVNLLNLDLCLIGGGLSNAGDCLYKPLERAFQAHLMPAVAGSVRLERASLGNRAGMLGAASMVFAGR